MTQIIRDAEPSDIEAILALNEASVPAVTSVSAGTMRWYLENAAYFRVGEHNQALAAFLIGMRAGTEYDSENYRWFCRHYEDFGYIDRVAVSGNARRLGFATRLYDDFRETLPDSVKVMTCEVNLIPPNPDSMQFHTNLGFKQVGSRVIDKDGKKVALLERKL